MHHVSSILAGLLKVLTLDYDRDEWVLGLSKNGGATLPLQFICALDMTYNCN